VEDRTAALDGAGEVRVALAADLIGVDDLHELGRLVSGEVSVGGRTSVLRTVGMAIEDTAAAVALHEGDLAVGHAAGESLGRSVVASTSGEVSDGHV
jgi:ornithine cyclodeaminase